MRSALWRFTKFCLVLLILTCIIMFLGRHSSDQTASKPLDYSKPIYTEEGTLVCPSAKIYDPSEDRGFPAVFKLFTSILGRAEKARAIGCEEWGVRMLVHEEHTSSLPDGWVRIHTLANPEMSLITMQVFLTNGESEATEDTPSDPSDRYQKDRLDFQKRFGKLASPAPKLRWDPVTSSGTANNQVVIALVSPYGPCASVSGNTESNYYVLPIDMELLRLGSKSEANFLGPYQGLEAARQAAIDQCQSWYAALKSQPPDPAREGRMWFKPDVEIAPKDTEEPDAQATPSTALGIATESRGETSASSEAAATDETQ